ncbi:MAG: hypothetical protein E6R04_02350 [Spirochaetes bacterium]|nr:MAG: hypothetical protein E6R04_02350 [Spirochaetota bacterium]
MPPFFGLTPEDRAKVILEPFFALGYYFGMTSWKDYYHFPVVYRRWLIKRINEEIEKAAAAQNGNTSKGLHDNTPDIRSLTNKSRTEVPAKLRRFT